MRRLNRRSVRGAAFERSHHSRGRGGGGLDGGPLAQQRGHRVRRVALLVDDGILHKHRGLLLLRHRLILVLVEGVVLVDDGAHIVGRRGNHTPELGVHSLVIVLIDVVNRALFD